MVRSSLPTLSGNLRGTENCGARAPSGESKENQREGLLMAKPQRSQGRWRAGAVRAEAGSVGQRRRRLPKGSALLRSRPVDAQAALSVHVTEAASGGGSSVSCRLEQLWESLWQM